LEIVGGVPGRHDEALSAIAAVAGVTKNGVRNWLSNTNRPGRRSAEAIILAYDRELASRFGLLPLDRPDPEAGVQAQGRLAEVQVEGPEVQAPPAGPPARSISDDLRDLRLRLDDRTLAILDEILSLKKYNAGLQARLEKRDLDVELLRADNEKGLEFQAGALLDIWKRLSEISAALQARPAHGPAGAPDPGIPEALPVDLADVLPRPARFVAGRPPANGSDRSEPGLAAVRDDLGQ
jgi:hypothetical protein